MPKPINNFTVEVPDFCNRVTVNFNGFTFTINKDNSVNVVSNKDLVIDKSRNPKGTMLFIYLQRKNSFVKVLATTPNKAVNEVLKLISRVYKDYGSLHMLTTDVNGVVKEHIEFKLKEFKDYTFNYNPDEFNRFSNLVVNKPYASLTSKMRKEIPLWKSSYVIRQLSEKIGNVL